MFRKFTNPFLLVCWMVLSACAPALTPVPAIATPTLALEPTRTLTPKPTLLPTEIVFPTEVASKEIIWPAVGTETITQPKGLEFGMEFKDGNAAYKMVLEALISNPEQNGDFFQDLMGTRTPTVEQFLDYLRNSKGGPKNENYWFPFVSTKSLSLNFAFAPADDSAGEIKQRQIIGAFLLPTDKQATKAIDP